MALGGCLRTKATRKGTRARASGGGTGSKVAVGGERVGTRRWHAPGGRGVGLKKVLSSNEAWSGGESIWSLWGEGTGRAGTCRMSAGFMGDLGIGSLLMEKRDVIVTLGALVGSTTVVKTFDTLAERGYMEQNLSRKLIHTTCGPLFILSWLFFTQSDSARLLSAVIPFVNGLRLFLIGSGMVEDKAAVKAVSRKGDRTELLKGPFYYTIVLTIATVSFWRNPAGIIALSIMCGGDGLADIVGRKLGKTNKLFYNRSKSWAGSAAMLLGSFLLSEFLLTTFAQFGFLEGQTTEDALKVFLICAVTTVVESLPINKYIDDNITVPVTALVLGSRIL